MKNVWLGNCEVALGIRHTSTADCCNHAEQNPFGDRICFMSVFFIVRALLFSSMFSHTRAMLNLLIAMLITYDHSSLLHVSYVFFFCLSTVLKITSCQLFWVCVYNWECLIPCELVAKQADTISPRKLVFTRSKQLNVPVRIFLQQLALWRMNFNIRNPRSISIVNWQVSILHN